MEISIESVKDLDRGQGPGDRLQTAFRGSGKYEAAIDYLRRKDWHAAKKAAELRPMAWSPLTSMPAEDGVLVEINCERFVAKTEDFQAL